MTISCRNELTACPTGIREMLAAAQYDEKDVHWRRNLAYYSIKFAGDGFVVGEDAAELLKPGSAPA